MRDDAKLPARIAERSTVRALAARSTSLLREVRACTLCAAHLPSGPRPIVQLEPRATILIAGQAPGRKVHASGVPFQDASGDRLRAWMGVDAVTFYDPTRVAILPMGFCYPGTGRSGDLPPRPECAPAWRTRLLALLPNVKLTLIIGEYALRWHLAERQKATLTDTVQAWQEYWPDALPLPHPSPRNNIWLKRNPWFATNVLPRLGERVADCLGGPDRAGRQTSNASPPRSPRRRERP